MWIYLYFLHSYYVVIKRQKTYKKHRRFSLYRRKSSTLWHDGWRIFSEETYFIAKDPPRNSADTQREKHVLERNDTSSNGSRTDRVQIACVAVWWTWGGLNRTVNTLTVDIQRYPVLAYCNDRNIINRRHNTKALTPIIKEKKMYNDNMFNNNVDDIVLRNMQIRRC